MSPKLKKWIIASVVILIVVLAGLGGFSALGQFTTTTVSDLRIVDVETKAEILDKSVYLTSSGNNFFEFNLSYVANGAVNFNVESSSDKIASVAKAERGYVVTYHSVGKVTITASASDNASVKDSFTLTVHEAYPINFKLVDEKATGESEIDIFADATDYSYVFEATSLIPSLPVNRDTLKVVDDFNKEIFEDIHIDSDNSKLVIKAKQSKIDSVEYITINASVQSEDGSSYLANFIIKINVHGNYVSDMQLLLSTSPNFEGAKYVLGKGLLNQGEEAIETIIFTQNINIIYAKVRVVLTSGKIIDVTKDVNASREFDDGVVQKPLPADNYYEIMLTRGDEITFRCTYLGQEHEQRFSFLFHNEGTDAYKDFFQNLYRKVVKQNAEGEDYFVYEYNYWDTRYKRDDVITQNGEIVGFIGENPYRVDAHAL